MSSASSPLSARHGFQLLVFVGLFCFGMEVSWGATLVNQGSTWRYLDDGTDQGSAWRQPGFDDSGWTNGPAQLGYGEGDEATELSFGLVSTNKHITYYFRADFNVSDLSGSDFLKMQLLRDDGAVVYLNGVEVWRENMPAGLITHTTRASSVVGGSDEQAFFERTIPEGGLLVAGENSVAVEIHQFLPNSSDISFDFELIAQEFIQLIAPGAAWAYLDDGSDQGTAWKEAAYDDSAWSNGVAQLGYGDGGEATVLDFGGVSTNKHITYYFRHEFQSEDVSLLQGMRLRLLRDDGAVVYLNGTEVWRSNMPVGPINYQTRASVAIGGADESVFHTLTTAASPLVSGSNLVAVEIHQAGPNSSDISFDFELLGYAQLVGPEIIRGPYLQKGTPSSVVVRWRTDQLTNSVVQYGLGVTNLPFAVSSTSSTTEHELVLTGLDANTRYYYGVGDTGGLYAGGDTNHSFVTAPVVGTPMPTRIWVLGDSGTADQNARNVRNAFYSWTGPRDPDLWLMLGDNAYSIGTDQEHQAAVFDMYPRTLRSSVLWPTLGNHDGATADSASQSGPYYDIFTLPRNGEAGGLATGTEAYYSFDYANIHFVCLDSFETDRSPGGAMLTWLANDVAASTQKWSIAFWHHPPYSKGSHDSDDPVLHPELTPMRTNVLPILEAAGVDLVLSGHSHSYERSFLLDGHYGFSWELDAGTMIPDGGDGREGGDGAYDKRVLTGAVYVVAGSSGKLSGGALNHPAMFLSLNDLGSLVLDVDGNRLDAYFIGNTPVVKDSFTIIKGEPIYWLGVSVAGRGAVTPPGGFFNSNTLANLNAVASNFFSFAGWTGDLSGTGNPALLLMDSDKGVTATFDPLLVTNGVPMWWLDEHGLGTSDTDALADQDEDGMKTWEEYEADTAPTDSNSFFYVQMMSNAAASEVFFQSSASRVYTLRYVDELVGGTWSNVAGQVDVEGNGGMMSLGETVPSQPRLYGVGVELP